MLVDAVEYKLWKDDERWARQGQFEALREVEAVPAAAEEAQLTEGVAQ